MPRLVKRALGFARREIVLVVAVACALASCAAVPVDAAYAGYIDWRTLALLFSLMLAVAGFRSLGVLDALANRLLARAKTQRALAFSLVGLAFFASMAVTNDVALITFVPLAITALRRAGMEGRLGIVATLMTVAANLGSMLLPIGNPQSLYLFTASGMSVADFVALMAPYVAASAALLAAFAIVFFRSVACPASSTQAPACAPRDTNPLPERKIRPHRGLIRKNAQFVLFAGEFALCLLSVAGLVDARVALAGAIASALIADRSLLARVDYALLFTFAALFVFVGNVSRVPAVHDAVAGLVDGSALLAAVASSQVISNVPAAVLISGFTDRTAELIVGANLGGLGTLIASMASLITFKAVSIGRAVAPGRYIAIFTLVNAAFLAVLLALALVLGA